MNIKNGHKSEVLFNSLISERTARMLPPVQRRLQKKYTYVGYQECCNEFGFASLVSKSLLPQRGRKSNRTSSKCICISVDKNHFYLFQLSIT